MQSLFNEINNEAEKKAQSQTAELPNELPEAFQVLTTEKLAGMNGGRGGVHEVIVDTFMVDRAKGIIPDEKAKNKARKMKEVFPDKTYYVVGIYKRVIAEY